jgi:hypothetical protein
MLVLYKIIHTRVFLCIQRVAILATLVMAALVARELSVALVVRQSQPVVLVMLVVLSV